MPNPIEEYINSLEGKENLDPLTIARDLRELSMQEIGTREAKIEELNGAIAEKDTLITTKDSEIQTWKAKNFDLAMQIPSDNNNPVNDPKNGEKPDGATIKASDLFNKEAMRRRNF